MIEINICKNEHHFVDELLCPHCGEKSVKKIKARKGDCIACGQLCPVYAYGCNIPNEVKNNEDLIIK